MFESLFNRSKSEASNFKRFDEYLDISGMEEIRDVLAGLRADDKYAYLSNHEGILDGEFKSITTKHPYSSIIANVKTGLSDAMFSSDLIQFMNFRAVYELIWLSIESEEKRGLSSEEINRIIESDLPFKLTIGLDEYPMVNDFDILDVWFFKRMAGLSFDKRAMRLNSLLCKECLNDLNEELGIYFMTFNSLAFAAEYFTACFALRDDRDEMNCDDVVKAWLLMLNLFLSDIKPLIF